MAYSEELAARIRDVVGGRDGITERRMFGGIAWMVSGNMVCGTLGEDLMVRLDPDDAERAFDRGALGTAAQLVGVGRRLLDLTVAYAGERKQFGVPVGSQQAVKHHLADAAMRLRLSLIHI